MDLFSFLSFHFMCVTVTVVTGHSVALNRRSHLFSTMSSLHDVVVHDSAEGGPFVAIGDPEGDSIKSFWHKVCCKVCGDLFQLCPSKKNLAANLTSHVMGIKHVTKVELLHVLDIFLD
jgi:hypothetical protein